jgi:hypothetical protein
MRNPRMRSASSTSAMALLLVQIQIDAGCQTLLPGCQALLPDMRWLARAASIVSPFPEKSESQKLSTMLRLTRVSQLASCICDVLKTCSDVQSPRRSRPSTMPRPSNPKPDQKSVSKAGKTRRRRE